MAKSLSHKFGQIVGDLLELALLPQLENFAKQNKLFLDKYGIRKARSGKKVTWTDVSGNKHDLDFVLERGGSNEKIGTPVAFIESAWRRGTRHSKNKVQEIQAAINPIVLKNKATVCFKGAILGGDFTKPSFKQLESDNFSILYFSTDIFVKTFKKFDLDIFSDDATEESEFARRIESWASFDKKDKLCKELVKLNKEKINEFFASLTEAVSRYIEQVIVLPLHGEETISKSINEAIDFLKKYSDEKTKLPLLKYEIIVKYNNGDRIEASFKDKKDTIKFLESYL